MGFLVGFLEKWTKSANLGNFGVTPRRKDPTQRCGREGGLDKPWVRRGIAKLRRGEGLHCSIAVLRHSVATVHSMKIFVFCFVLFFVASRTCLLD